MLCCSIAASYLQLNEEGFPIPQKPVSPGIGGISSESCDFLDPEQNCAILVNCCTLYLLEGIENEMTLTGFYTIILTGL